MTDIAQLGLEIRSDGVVVASKRLRDLESQSSKTSRASDQLLEKAKRLNAEMGRLGRTLSTRVTLPILGAAGGAIKLATDFDSALTRINTLVGISREEIAMFRQEILNMAGAVGRGPVELAEGLFAITSAGQSGTAALKTLQEASKASAIGLGETRDIALATVAAMEAYGEGNLSSARAVEILIGTIEQGNLEASELASTINQALPLATSLGVAFEDLGAFIASFSRQGANAARGVTALRGVLNTFLKPTDDTVKALEEMGTSLQEVRAEIIDRGFTVAVQDLVVNARRAGVELGRLFPNLEGLTGVLGVFGGELGSAEERLKAVSAAVGTLEQRFQAVIDQDPQMAFNMMRAEVDALAIQIGANLMPVWLDFLQGVRDLALEFRRLEESEQELIVNSALLAAALGPALIVMSSLVNISRTLIPLFLTKNPLALGATALAAGALAGVKINGFFNDAITGAQSLTDTLRDLNPQMREFNKEVGDTRADYLRTELEKVQNELNLLINRQDMLNFERLGQSGNVLMATQGELAATRRRIEELEAAERALSEQIEINNKRRRANTLRQAEATQATAKAGEELSFLGAILQSNNELVARATQRFMQKEEAMKKAQAKVASFSEEMEDMAAELEGPAAVALLQFTRKMEELNEIAADPLSNVTGDEITRYARIIVENYRRAISDASVEETFADVAARGIAEGLARGLDSLTASDLATMSFGDIGGVIGKSIFGSVGGAVGEALGTEFSETFANMGEKLGDTLSESIGDSLGESLGKIAPVIGNIIGELLGQYIFDKIFPEKEPKFQVGGAIGFGATGAGRIGFDLSPATPFGDLFIRTRKLSEDAQDQLRNALISFDSAIAAIITDEGQMKAITDALSRWGYDTQDEGMTLQRVLESRFAAIVSTFDQFGQDMIMSGATLEEQIENMLSLLIIRAQLAIGDSMGEGITDDTQVFLAMELARAGESMADSFQRLVTITGSLNTAMNLTGNRIGGGTAAIARFGDALQRAFGDDLQRLTSGLETIFDTFFSEEERLAEQVEASRGSATQLLEQLGVEVTDDMLSKTGFRDLFDTLFGTLDPESTAILIEAGVKVSELIEAEEKLAEARGEATEQARTAAEIARERESLELRELQLLGNTAEIRSRELDALDESNRAILERIFLLEDEAMEREKQAELSRLMADVSQEMLELISPTRAEFARLTNAFAEQITRAQELGASEEQLGQIRALQNMQIQRFVADLQISILRLKEDLFGANDQFEQVGDTISNVADQINRNIIRALENVDDWLAKSNLSSVSPLTPQQRLETAESGFRSAFESAMAGDLQALESLPQLADAFIGEAADFFGTSNQEFVSLFNSVRSMMQQASQLTPEEIKPPTYDQIDTLINSTNNVNTSVNATTSEIEKLERELKAFEVSDEIATLAAITGRQPSEIARELGFSGQNMRDVLRLLGVDIPELTGVALDDKFNNVVGAISATNFLLGTVDNSLDALTTLNTIAQLTGQTPSEIANALGFSSESMLHILRTLGVDIPEGTEEQLSKYFNDIVAKIISGNGTNITLLRATQTIERNLWAIGDALVQVVTALGASFSVYDLENGIKAGFDGSNSPIVSKLMDVEHAVHRNTQILEQNLWAIGGVLVEIRNALQGTPSFAVGGPVQHTGLANVHSGEYVVPRNGALVSSDPQVAALLERVDLRLRNLERISEVGFDSVVSEERQTRNDMRRTRQTVRA